MVVADQEQPEKGEQVQLRENLSETAFFYPQLLADANGEVTMKFTLPEAVTTWRFMGLAHDKEMNFGMLNGEAVAQKTIMVQPNMPRFLRMGDKAVITTRIMNTSDKAVSGKATLTLMDPENDQTLYTRTVDYQMDAKATTSAAFDVDVSQLPADATRGNTGSLPSLLICRVTAQGDGYSDGEQHYLPVLNNVEYITNTLPFTQNEAGTKRIDLTKMIPADAKNTRLTVEYTGNPSWLMIQALPYVADASEKNALSLVSALYANTLASHIMQSSPKIKSVFEAWRNEGRQGDAAMPTSLQSQLEKNQELKSLVLTETPWVADARNEREQRMALGRYFDENTLSQQLNTLHQHLADLQNSDGSFSWLSGMRGSFYMTVMVNKTLVRLNSLLGSNAISL